MIPLILNIETATKNCSVSLAKDGNTIDCIENNTGNYSHAEKLHLYIDDILSKNNFTVQQLDAIAVSKGPGSYTGLRIGVSTAKGLAYALDKPLISVNTLESLAHQNKITKGFIIPMLDARRLEVYSAVFNHQYEMIEDTAAVIVDENSYKTYLEKGDVYFLGDAAEKCQEIIKHPHAHFTIPNIFPSAKEMSRLSWLKYQQNQFEDVAYFEPFYLKDFLVTPSKKKL